jgi:hypothetical protein
MPPSPANTVDTPLQFPSQSENDSPTKPVSNSPRELVRRVVERTSDKLGRSKSVGSKSQHSPKPQRTSSYGSSKRFVSQGRKGKDQQTANITDLGGTFSNHSSSCSRLAHVIEGGAAAQVADSDSSSTFPNPDSTPIKQGMGDESPFIRPSSPASRSQLSPPKFQGSTSAGVLLILIDPVSNMILVDACWDSNSHPSIACPSAG